MGSPEEAGQGDGETQGEVTGQGKPRSPKMVQRAEGGKGKDKRERIIVVFRSPCQENYPADAHPGAHRSVLESANPAWTRSVHLDAPGQWHGQQPVSGTADPGAQLCACFLWPLVSKGSLGLETCGGEGGRLARGHGVRLFACAGAYWPLALAHSDPPKVFQWVRRCFGCVDGAPG